MSTEPTPLPSARERVAADRARRACEDCGTVGRGDPCPVCRAAAARRGADRCRAVIARTRTEANP